MTDRWQLTPRAHVEASAANEPGVLVDTHNAGMFLCNDVAWELLETLGQGADVGALTAQLTARFEISEEAAQKDLLAFLYQLKRMGLADDRA